MKSKKYWAQRNAALEQSLQKDAHIATENIIRSYTRSIEELNADIRSVFKAYVANGVPEGEATKLLNKAEHDKLYTELVKLYDETSDPKIKDEILARINAQAYGSRISRLEGVKQRVYIKLRAVGNYAQKQQKRLYTKTLQTSYYTNIYNIAEGLNCGIDFTVLPQRAIDRMLREPWKGSNYSERVWKHNDEFINAVQDTIETGIIAGHGTRRMAEQLKDFVNGGDDDAIRYKTERLTRTETSHFMNSAQLAAYEEIGIDQYQFLAALSERTCEVCAALDGKIFYVKDAVEGKNFAPLHPMCRCITIMAGTMPNTRIARDPLTGKNYKVDGSMTFAEWKESLTDEQKAALKYVDKSAKSDIMKSGSGSNIMKPDEIIHRSLGASGRNYPVKLPNGNHAKFAEGTKITNIKVFAGKDTNEPIRDAIYLENTYGIDAEKWQKVRGEGIVVVDKVSRKAEVHWYEAEDQKVQMKVKRYLDEN